MFQYHIATIFALKMFYVNLWEYCENDEDLDETKQNNIVQNKKPTQKSVQIVHNSGRYFVSIYIIFNVNHQYNFGLSKQLTPSQRIYVKKSLTLFSIN